MEEGLLIRSLFRSSDFSSKSLAGEGKPVVIKSQHIPYIYTNSKYISVYSISLFCQEEEIKLIHIEKDLAFQKKGVPVDQELKDRAIRGISGRSLIFPEEVKFFSKSIYGLFFICVMDQDGDLDLRSCGT